jgi:hypothetical protein
MGGVAGLARAIRPHAKFVERAPLTLIVIAFAEASGAPTPVVHALGVALVAAQLASAYPPCARCSRAPARWAGGEGRPYSGLPCRSRYCLRMTAPADPGARSPCRRQRRRSPNGPRPRENHQNSCDGRTRTVACAKPLGCQSPEPVTRRSGRARAAQLVVGETNTSGARPRGARTKLDVISIKAHSRDRTYFVNLSSRITVDEQRCQSLGRRHRTALRGPP